MAGSLIKSSFAPFSYFDLLFCLQFSYRDIKQETSTDGLLPNIMNTIELISVVRKIIINGTNVLGVLACV